MESDDISNPSSISSSPSRIGTYKGGRRALARRPPFVGAAARGRRTYSTGAAADAAGFAAVAAAGGVDGVSNYQFYKDFTRWAAAKMHDQGY